MATPIGNLDDLSPRAARALADADVIACEDTRVTRKLLTRVKTAAHLVSYRSSNERERAADLSAKIAAGAHVTLVTDAGTPGISDPGHPLIEACVEQGLKIEVIPGPSAAVAALVVSGLPTARFVFEGFLPHARQARLTRLREIADEPRTLVLFEAPHRIAASLADMVAVLGASRRVAMAREMTKIHEEVVRTTLQELHARVADVRVRGEITLVIEGAPLQAVAHVSDEELSRMIAELVDAGVSKRDAIAEVSTITGEPRNRVYKAATGG